MKTAVRRVLRGGLWAMTRLRLSVRLSDRRDVLLCCNDPLMTKFLRPLWELFREDHRLKFRVVLLPPSSFKRSDSELDYMRAELPVREVGTNWAYSRAWDLVVCADHCFGNARRRSPSVFISHGMPGKIVPGETEEYSCSQHARDKKGRIVYRRIFTAREADAARLIESNPALEGTLVAVGDLENDQLLEQSRHREEFRREFGYKPEDVVVFVQSTWGEHCIWHTIGDALLSEARRLQSEFKFILSTHPHEYRAKPPGERVWGEYLRSFRADGFVVREPSEGWIPYMVASDIVVSDHTNLVQAAVLLEKPVIFSPVPKDVIWKESATWKIQQFAPVLEDAGRLGEYLSRAKEDYPFDKLHELAREIHPHAGEAAGRICREIYNLLGIPRLDV